MVKAIWRDPSQPLYELQFRLLMGAARMRSGMPCNLEKLQAQCLENASFWIISVEFRGRITWKWCRMLLLSSVISMAGPWATYRRRRHRRHQKRNSRVKTSDARRLENPQKMRSSRGNENVSKWWWQAHSLIPLGCLLWQIIVSFSRHLIFLYEEPTEKILMRLEKSKARTKWASTAS